MSLTAEQLLERRDYLGGTDAAALAGVNPPGWAQPIDVYLEKVGLAPERKPSATMSMGHVLEPVVAQLFTEATGLRLRRPGKPVRSRRYPWMGGHLDRWAEDGLPFEAKTANSRHEWGPGLGVGTPEAPVVIPAPGDESYQPRVPLRYAVQVQHYLAVTERPTAYLAVLLGWGDFRWYAIHRDSAMIATLVELERQFWHENVLAGVPPEPDGSESYGRRLRQLYASDDGTEAVATPEQQLLLEDIRLARQATAAATAAQAALEQRLQQSMGSHSRLVAPGATVSWKQNQPTTRVRWEDWVVELLKNEQFLIGGQRALPRGWPEGKASAAKYLRELALSTGMATTEPGARPFRVEFDSDEEARGA